MGEAGSVLIGYEEEGIVLSELVIDRKSMGILSIYNVDR